MRALPFVAIVFLAACSAPRETDTAHGTSPLARTTEPPSQTTAPQSQSAPPAEPPAATEPPRPSQPEPTPPAWLATHAIPSNGGAYVVHVLPAPDRLPDNEPFQLEVWVADAARPDALARDVELSVAAAMPEHGHGMNRVPRVSKRDDGSFLVDGMLFHMTGHWELYLDVTRGAVTERTQCDIVLE